MVLSTKNGCNYFLETQFINFFLDVSLNASVFLYRKMAWCDNFCFYSHSFPFRDISLLTLKINFEEFFSPLPRSVICIFPFKTIFCTKKSYINSSFVTKKYLPKKKKKYLNMAGCDNLNFYSYSFQFKNISLLTPKINFEEFFFFSPLPRLIICIFPFETIFLAIIIQIFNKSLKIINHCYTKNFKFIIMH